MKPDIKLNPHHARTLLLAMAGGGLLLLVTLFTYLLLPELKRYGMAQDTLMLPNSTPAETRQLDNQLAQLRTEVETLRHTIHGDMAQRPTRQLGSYIIESLQNLSWHNRMQLTSLVPRSGSRIDVFQELIFDIELTGSYMDFYRWIHELNDQLGFVVISSFDMRPVRTQEDDTRIDIKLTLVAYKAES
ncbi:type 4a pilus biogenesis protein PilO [Oceanimonas marisflavi]|uniref:type 4a pilus biogenesis protein PilO n=1 Tax=Oceanimonas marisflavi TaxID=2059724 RepID=UPI000D30A914|nr:type 4a pilus biogenesis protein PilO [Oceanimonas marisflavi]